MKLYNVNIGGLIIRFHLLTAFIVVMGFAGLLYPGIIIGMMLFLASIMGIQFKLKRRQVAVPLSIRNVHIPASRYAIWHQRHHWAGH